MPQVQQVKVYELPFTAKPQIVAVRLAGTLYKFRLSWNVFLNSWVMNIYDNSDNLIDGGIPLVMGCNLLEQHKYLNIGGKIFGLSDHGPGDVVPDFYDLGVNGHVYFLPDNPQT